MSATNTVSDKIGVAEQHRARAKVWFESLRDRICAEVEALDVEPQQVVPGQAEPCNRRL